MKKKTSINFNINLNLNSYIVESSETTKLLNFIFDLDLQ